ncbi:MAG: HEPN domain-containing protein [Patescibacteria group bacterium]
MKNNKGDEARLVNEWLIKGQNDLKAARILYREKGPSDTLCFHCHQATEKYLKAYLVFQKIHFEKIHHLWQLAKICAQKDKDFLKFEETFKSLDAYYIESRYPSEVSVYPREESKKTLALADELTQFIAQKIK